MILTGFLQGRIRTRKSKMKRIRNTAYHNCIRIIFKITVLLQWYSGTAQIEYIDIYTIKDNMVFAHNTFMFFFLLDKNYRDEFVFENIRFDMLFLYI